MPVTIRDIAEAANVSKAAVSYVINGKPGVSDETRRRILQIMKKMNYRPNANARGLAGRQTEMLGLVIPDITDMFYANIIRGVEARANEFGYVLNLCTTHGEEEREKDVVDMFTSGRVDGVILMAYFLTGEYFRKLKSREVPFVTIDSRVDDESIYSITVDNEKIGYIAAEYLIGLGHRRVAFIHGALKGSEASNRRFAGFRQAFEDHGLPVDRGYVKQGDFRRVGGHEAAKELLSLRSRPTAVFAANDQMALGVLSAAVEMGIRVPDDLSIIGVDDIEAASFVKPPLTTIKQPTYEMGRLAVDIVLGLRKGEVPGERRILLEPEIVVRGSCTSMNRALDKAL